MSHSRNRLLALAAVILTLLPCACSDDPAEPAGGAGGGSENEGFLQGHPDSSAVGATTLRLPVAVPANEIVDHFLMNRVTALVRLEATVGEVNGALAQLDARIVSMNPGDNWLSLRVPAATVADAEAAAAGLVATGAFALAFPSFEVGTREIPGIDESDQEKIRHLTRMKWPAAWNAARAAKAKVTVIVPDQYRALDAHDEIDAQRFPVSARGGATDRIDPSSGVNDGNHGFMTAGILGANWDSTPLTGTSRNPTALLDIVSIPLGGLSLRDAIEETVRHMPGSFTRFVVSASFGYPDSMPPATLETDKFKRAMIALYWRHRMAAYRANSFVASAAGNRGNQSGPDRLSEFDSWHNPDLMVEDIRDMADPAQLSSQQLAALNDQHAHYLGDEPLMDTRAMNGVVVGSSDADGQESAFSSVGADVRVLGEGVWALCVVVDPNCLDPSSGASVSGTSFAAPQVAGLAAYLWSIDDRLTPDRIRDIMFDAYNASEGCVDAYRAALSLDASLTPAGAPVRLAIMDVAGARVNDPPDGKFNEVDLQKFVQEFAARGDGARDYSRYDLNGDGFTGGTARAEFDLSADSPHPTIDSEPLKQVIEGTSVDFAEGGLTDGEICLYYAYSSLWALTGDTGERRSITCANLSTLLASGSALLTGSDAAFQPCRDPLTMITSDVAADVTPAWSPDGSKITFMSNRSGGWTNIWVISSAGGSAAQITFEPQNSHPAWSPGGTEIAFMSNRSGSAQIWTIPATGGSPTQLTAESNNTHPAWSPDGTEIAFVSTLAGAFTVWTMPAAGGEPTQITTGPGQARQPAWSPDGTKIAYGLLRSGVTHIWVVPATGGTPTQVTTHPMGGDEPAWSPDGTRIAFMSQRSGNWDIWTIPAAGGAATQITTSPQTDRQPAWSPDGTRIAFTSHRSGNDDIWVITLP